ncbi:hypothetical protein [Desulfurivibrio dismutans]|uniref:hypothetical protein n=1 Tax=Desulfurivibrio dismutans TaxID=1398908 RepID=UPI0023DAEEDC|nr:hypothetical protein [Desulfurivibrio alkaliphilus]MDF1613655.1 hypothetical protein [Desulfurivibrio alkaliphilus]
MSDLQKRLARLEAQHLTTGPECVKIVTVKPGPDGGPAIDEVGGWELTTGRQIMRDPGESDPALTARAIAAAKEENPGALPILWSIPAETITEEV